MKIKTTLATTLLILTFASRGFANIVGYANIPFVAGDTWFGNVFDNSSGNTLSVLFPTAPTGTTISLWNSTSDQFNIGSAWDGSHWSVDLTLNPGTGALLHTSSLFTNLFLGSLENFDGTILPLGGSLTNPPPFAGPNGLYLFSSKFPATLSSPSFHPADGALDVFTSIIGRAPNAGEQVTTFDPATQTTFTSTFSGTAWDVVPTLGMGRAALFNLGPVAVPEPSTIGLLFASAGVTALVRSHRRSKS